MVVLGVHVNSIPFKWLFDALDVDEKHVFWQDPMLLAGSVEKIDKTFRWDY